MRRTMKMNLLFSKKMMWVNIRQEFLRKECLTFITI